MKIFRDETQSLGNLHADIREELVRFSRSNRYVAEQFADACCQCSGKSFKLGLDEDAAVAVRFCQSCGEEHGMADSDAYFDEAEPVLAKCTCGADMFEITIGVALYANSEDAR